MTTVLLVSLPIRYVQLPQLLGRHLARRTHERILRILVHREGVLPTPSRAFCTSSRTASSWY